jgi:hypothetical protein
MNYERKIQCTDTPKSTKNMLHGYLKAFFLGRKKTSML